MASDISTNIDPLQTQIDFARYNLSPYTTPSKKPSILLQILKNQTKKQERFISLLFLSTQKHRLVPKPDTALKFHSNPPVSSPKNLFSFGNQFQPLPKINKSRFVTPIRLNTKNLSSLSRKREKKNQEIGRLEIFKQPSPIYLKKTMVNWEDNS